MSPTLLSGLRVLELGHYIAAPFAARLLADLGADVIKVEPPGGGDPVRTWGTLVDGKSPWWSVAARNKQSVTINLRHPEAPALVLDLARHADVVIENYKPGQLEKWGMGPRELEAARPGLTLVRISGYGQTGRKSPRAGFGVIGEAESGFRHLCGYPGNVSDLPPVRAGISIGDSVAGLYGALGAVSAVLEQRISGRREIRIIDVALTESMLSLMEGCLPEYGVLGQVRQPQGARLVTTAPSNAYRSSDGVWVLIAANSDVLFNTLAAGIMGQAEFAEDPRFTTNPARLANIDELDRRIAAWVLARAADDVLEQLEAGNIPASKIFTIADVAADGHNRDRDMVLPIADARFDRPVLHPGVVPSVAGQDRGGQIRWTGPDVGQHNDDIYSGLLGLSPAAVAGMRERGLI